ncbi:sensor histidine kinase [Christiangramia crocea]|uniref:histidine kinase n=1 Tax=Christiangramia crocea TaxID=2904124 RepID=A0A9X1UUZ9_9FLAO|nr:HAMP domain-containing sensor histidine kinase [Gramella crocea]MCG9970611.1 HAMP domain-containing histidine kinase [Gramella crocea]
MKKRIIYIGIFIISVVGLFIVQYQYLRIGLSLAKVQFEQKVENTGNELKKELVNENQLSFLIAESFSDRNYFSLSRDSLQDASRYFLNDLIEKKLNENKIKTDFSYHLFSKDSLINLASPTEFEDDESSIKYPVILEGYLPDVLKKELTLQLEFQDLNAYFLSQLKGLLIPGLLFLAIIIFVVIWMLRLFFWQRNLITITNDFINNLTHELKTPVFSIGIATKILEKDLNEKQKPILFQIRKQVSRLNNHIEQVLGLASLESKEIIELKKVDLRPELQEWCEDFKMLADLENFQFKYDLEPGKYMIKTALFHFENAINNLLDNAKKYSEDPEILLKAYTGKNRLFISIIDNGKGISNKEKRHIFKKFYRASEGNLHRTKGYGLGLSYVKEIVKRHRGRIKVLSEQNEGTEITILIPLNE